MELFGYSLWLQPEGGVYKKFITLIKTLAVKYKGPVFEPHVTLLGLISNKSEQEVITKTEQLAKKHNRFVIQLTDVDCQSYYFRTLFVLAKKTPELMKLNRHARLTFAMQNEPPFMPHLSLLYGNYPQEIKEKIIKEIGRDQQIRFDISNIVIVHSSGHEDTWKIIREIPLRQ